MKYANLGALSWFFLEKWHLFGNTFKQSTKGNFEAVPSTADTSITMLNIFSKSGNICNHLELTCFPAQF